MWAVQLPNVPSAKILKPPTRRPRAGSWSGVARAGGAQRAATRLGVAHGEDPLAERRERVRPRPLRVERQDLAARIENRRSRVRVHR